MIFKVSVCNCVLCAFVELPHKPVVTSVLHNPSDLRSINVSWSPGFDGNSPIQRLILQYRKVDYIPDKGNFMFVYLKSL